MSLLSPRRNTHLPGPNDFPSDDFHQLESFSSVDSSQLNHTHRQNKIHSRAQPSALRAAFIKATLVLILIVAILSLRGMRQENLHSTRAPSMYQENTISFNRVGGKNLQKDYEANANISLASGLQKLYNGKQSNIVASRESHETKKWYGNPFALRTGELPGYTGWARPEQTLAGYFEITSSSHKYSQQSDPPDQSQSILISGEKFSVLLTCVDVKNDYYSCPPLGGSLFYVRAYGPAVITGYVTDHRNSSYTVELFPPDPGEYTVEVVITFSAPFLDYSDFPINSSISTNHEHDTEPGYEGYLVSGFPIWIFVNPTADVDTSSSKEWCNLIELTEQSPLSSLTKGHWQVIDNVARSSHQPLTRDDTLVSLDGYRMGLNSVGVRMQYVYEDCLLMRIRDIVGDESHGSLHAMDKCLHGLGYHADQKFSSSNSTNGTVAIDSKVDVIFIGDSVMKMEMGFFEKLLERSSRDGVTISFIETNGGIHVTLPKIISTLKKFQSPGGKQNNPNLRKSVILMNSGLHDIDILCSSKRKRSRNQTSTFRNGGSCAEEYRARMTQLIRFVDAYPADLKVFRTTIAGGSNIFLFDILPSPHQLISVLFSPSSSGWPKFGNYGFSWPATEMQPMSRSSHLVHHFNEIVFDIVQNHSNVHVSDGYWITLPRPDHTQASKENQVGKHLVHPGYEIMSVLARKWMMLILSGLCGETLRTH